MALEDKTAAFKWLKDVVYVYLLYKMQYFIGLSATNKFDNHAYELFVSFNIFLITMIHIRNLESIALFLLGIIFYI